MSLTHTPTQTAQGAYGSSGQDSPGEYLRSCKTARNGYKTALKSLRGQLGVKRPQVQVLSLGPKILRFPLKSEDFYWFCSFFRMGQIWVNLF